MNMAQKNWKLREFAVGVAGSASVCTSPWSGGPAEEFVAHGSSVNCLALNQSGRTLATGGEDRKVNLWAVGSPNLLIVSAHAPNVVVLGTLKCEGAL